MATKARAKKPLLKGTVSTITPTPSRTMLPEPTKLWLLSLRGTPTALDVVRCVMGLSLSDQDIIDRLFGAPTATTSGGAPHNLGGFKSNKYWMKAVTGYDPSKASGYALRGPFVNKKDILNQPAGTLIVLQYRTPTELHLDVLIRLDNSQYDVTFPGTGTQVTIPGVDLHVKVHNYADLFAILKNHRIPAV